MKQRCLILVDGSNFYFKLKDLQLHNLLDFNFREFAKFLARSGVIKEDLLPFIQMLNEHI